MVGEVGEQRPETAPDELGALHGAEQLGAVEVVRVGLEARLADHDVAGRLVRSTA